MQWKFELNIYIIRLWYHVLRFRVC
jgi:hypothetical protein